MGCAGAAPRVRDWLLNSGTVVKKDSPEPKAIADAQQASKAPAKAK